MTEVDQAPNCGGRKTSDYRSVLCDQGRSYEGGSVPPVVKVSWQNKLANSMST